MSTRTIRSSELRTADILLTAGRDFISGGIRTATGTDYSHAILYIGDGQVIEAIREGVDERPLTDALSETSLAVVLRRRYLNNQSKAMIVETARRFVGLPYDYVGAGGAGMTHKRSLAGWVASPVGSLALGLAALRNAAAERRDTRMFCSELVARSFELAGFPVSEFAPSFTTPRSLRVSPFLIYVGHLVGGP